ncbi:Glutamine--fructose-6-phosphate aminotransferase [isomerizing] [compost metagenome]
MCGVFGFFETGTQSQDKVRTKKMVDKLFLLSETRGRDASGIVVQGDGDIHVLKRYLTASEFIKTGEYNSIFDSLDGPLNQSVKVMGHARLATNGMTFLELNNQPVVAGDMVAVHNGIVTNDSELWSEHPEMMRKLEVDTELMLKLFEKYALQYGNIEAGVKQAFKEFEGNVSCGLISPKFDSMVLATNNGSLYFSSTGNCFIFASERLILSEISREFFNSELTVKQLLAGNMLTVSKDGQSISVESQSLGSFDSIGSPFINHGSSRILDLTNLAETARSEIQRCTRCILPETFPFIKFDKDGVCNHCHQYTKVTIKDEKSRDECLMDFARLKKDSKGADCLLMLSGGRDSCYGLHHAVRELGLKPIAYTYDWGMVTDIARRNAERMCGKLGIEHIIVSADIRKKRENIRKNISAWLKKPELGMVPIFMAGDKQFLYYGKKIRDINNLPFTVISTCPFEKTGFKTGFAGVDEGKDFIYKIPLASKAKFFGYYATQFLTNPAYINSSLVDSMHGFWSAFLMKHDFFQTFDYEYWEEKKIINTLTSQYNWELDPEAGTSWRIGDGTAAFYNLIYYTIAGFTENDTFRSHQIREGVISREDALRSVQMENQPRWKSLEWYASVIGFNLSEAVRVISHAPKIYIKS